ncbi:hypothetical protein, partial [Streptomyces gulbargensis]
HYGKHDVSVMNGILESLNNIAIVSDSEIQEEVWEFCKYILAAIDQKELDVMDQDHIRHTAARLATTCRKELKW